MSEFDEKIRERKLFKGLIGTRLNRTITIENRRAVDGYKFQVRVATKSTPASNSGLMNPEGRPISAANNLAMPDQVWRARTLEDGVLIANQTFRTSASVSRDGFTPIAAGEDFPTRP
jgi:hypothetical protein